MSTASTLMLGQALDALVAVAESAGLRAETARGEGCALAAAVAESAPGAPPAWSEAIGGGSTQDFFNAASRGRRWRAAPTATLDALVAQGSPHAAPYAEAMAEVVSAACGLGEPTMRVIGNASVAAAAQLTAAGVRPAIPSPATEFSMGTTTTASSTELSERELLQRAASDKSAEAALEKAALPAPPAPAPKTVTELLDELDALVGLDRVKREIHRQVAILRVQKLRTEARLKQPTITRHLVFTGNPGTGKTTVARLISGIYAAMELLSQGQLIEADRNELVGGYLGQTSLKTAELVESAAGGVLFIDEAYSLTGDAYGEEAVDTLVKEMEDRRDDLVVIVAGYPAPMEAFIRANPGLESRFRTVIEFDDYTDDELVTILKLLAAGADFDLTPGALTRFRELLAETPRGESFGNGRFARNMLEAAIGSHAWRLRDVEAPSQGQLRQLEPEDLDPDPASSPDQDLKPAPVDPDQDLKPAPVDPDPSPDNGRPRNRDHSPDQDQQGGPA